MNLAIVFTYVYFFLKFDISQLGVTFPFPLVAISTFTNIKNAELLPSSKWKCRKWILLNLVQPADLCFWISKQNCVDKRDHGIFCTNHSDPFPVIYVSVSPTIKYRMIRTLAYPIVARNWRINWFCRKIKLCKFSLGHTVFMLTALPHRSIQPRLPPRAHWFARTFEQQMDNLYRAHISFANLTVVSIIPDSQHEIILPPYRMWSVET